MKRLLIGLLLLSAGTNAAMAAPAPAAQNAAVTPFDKRVEQLIAILNDAMPVEDYFTSSFLAAVPPAQMKAITSSLRTQHGKAFKILSVTRKGANSATLTVELERAIGTIDITVESSAPNKVAGLLATGFAMKGDTPAKIDADFAALPGISAYVVKRLGSDQAVASRNADQPMAIASSFKLYILAELAGQIRSGKRKWSDVAPLGPPVPSSPATDRWPTGAPATLASLSAQMIAVSDNRATDTLIAALGRGSIEERIAKIGVAAPDKMLPMLTTTEMIALKSQAALRTRFLTSTEKQQRAFLEQNASLLGADDIDLGQLGSGPVAIDAIEWFASANDLARLLGSDEFTNASIFSIMAINTGVAPATAQKWRYLGYKGGSEPGVIAMNFLAQSKSGNWYAITGAWNNPAKEVNNAAFAALMTRLLDSVAN